MKTANRRSAPVLLIVDSLIRTRADRLLYAQHLKYRHRLTQPFDFQ